MLLRYRQVLDTIIKSDREELIEGLKTFVEASKCDFEKCFKSAYFIVLIIENNQLCWYPCLPINPLDHFQAL